MPFLPTVTTPPTEAQVAIAYEDWHRPGRAINKDRAHARRQVTRVADPVKNHATSLLLAGI